MADEKIIGKKIQEKKRHVHKASNMNVIERKHHKFGQIETFGLIFIVILISLGFFIFVSFKSRQTVDNPQTDYTNEKLSEDFVLSILDVTVKDCDGFTVNDLIVDCARDQRISCKNGAQSSCDAVNESISTMLNKTIMARKVRFRLYSENIYDLNGNNLMNITYLNCTPTSRQGPAGKATIPLHPDPRVVYIKMNICY